MNRRAIISVYDKTGVERFARGLVEQGITLLSTGGTADYLTKHGIEHEAISSYTGSPEILDGRVKSLHPKIHGGILARRDNDEDMRQLAAHGISPIDFVVVNLYPFIQQAAKVREQGDPNHGSLVEQIDIGGPTMIRAAAKNCRFVVPVCDPADYESILAELTAGRELTLVTRQRLAAKVFAMMAAYDGEVARYFSLGEKLLQADGAPPLLAPIETFVLHRESELRYGENPHQHAGLYRRWNQSAAACAGWWQQLQGKELSYNNLLDMQATIDLFLELSHRGAGGAQSAAGRAAVIVKHSNPCGAAIAETPLEAFRRAWNCDPLSAFGGIVAIGGTVDEELAKALTEGFIEVLLADGYTAGAEKILQQKKNLRVITCDFSALREQLSGGSVSLRCYGGDFLLQSNDAQTAVIQAANGGLAAAAGSLPAGAPGESLLADLNFAWKVCKHVKSNAIVIVKDGRAVGVGAGQMSRVDAAKLAVDRARLHGHDVNGAAAASDAFLPFADTLEILADAGVTALAQPGGSLRDKEVIAEADKRGLLMVFTGERHFRH